MLRLQPAKAITTASDGVTAASPPVAIARDFDDPYLELLRLLREAAEIEHALMVQYLYAAFAVRPEYFKLQGATSASARNLMGVAIQEMKHFDDVNRLLVELGASPCMERQDFPYEPDIYPFPFHLERLTPESLAKYAWTEAPSGALEPGPATTPADQDFLDRLGHVLGPDVRPNHLGSVYGTMIQRLEEVAAAAPSRFPDLATWVAKLEAIKDEGEDVHYRFFRSVFMGEHTAFADNTDIWSLPMDDPLYPSFPVPMNPTALISDTPAHQEDPIARKAWLSDLHYWTILMLLDLAYRHEMPTSGIAKRHMTEPLLALGIDLAANGHGMPFDPLSMGYAGGVAQAGSVEVLRRLVVEADGVARRLEGERQLPADYPIDINTTTTQQLAQMRVMDG